MEGICGLDLLKNTIGTEETEEASLICVLEFSCNCSLERNGKEKKATLMVS